MDFFRSIAALCLRSSRHGQRNIIFSGVVATICTAASLGAVAASAAAAGLVAFDIASQNAGRALVEFAKQAQVSMLLPTERINQITTNAVHGEYPIDKALDILLRDTGLVGEVNEEGVLAIDLAADSAAANPRTAASWLSPPSAGVSTAQLEEIIVTAQKREENPQRLPLAVRAFGSERLRRTGVQQLFQLEKLDSDVQISTITGSPRLAIRGINGANAAPSGEQPNAVHVNGAYLPRHGAYNGHFFDLERIEVLKGPQGTLYGRNAVGGAVNIISRRPDDYFGGYGQLEIGNFEYRRLEGALNFPLNQALAIRLALQDQRRNGFWKNGMNDMGERNLRATLRWHPDEVQELTLIYDNEHARNKGSANSTLARASHPLTVVPEKWDNSTIYGVAPPSFYRVNQYGVTAQYDRNFEPSTLTVIGTYRRLRQDDYGPNSATPMNVSDQGVVNGMWTYHVGNFGQSTFEARLASKNVLPLEWVFGLFALQQKNNGGVDDFTPSDFYAAPQGSATAIFDNPYDEAQAYAVFGQTTWTPSGFRRLHATAGARFSIDHRRTTTVTGGTQVIVPSIVATHSDTWDALTWRGALAFDLNDSSMLYLSASTGYQAGGFAYAPPGRSPKYKPEAAISYEIGSKNEFLDKRLRLNMEAYYTDYRDKSRIYYFVTPPAFNINVGIGNYDVKYRGASMTLQAELSRSARLTLNASYLKAESGGWQGSQIYPTLQNEAEGERIRSLAPWRGNAAYLHTWRLLGGQLSTEIQMQYFNPQSTKTTLSDGAVVYTAQPESTRWDLLIGYAPQDANWDLLAYVRNLEDAYDGSYTYNQAQAGGSQFVTITPMPPRTYGLSLNIGF